MNAKSLIAIVLAVVVTACGSNNIDEMIEQARHDIEQGRPEPASKTAISVVENDSSRLTATQWGELSLIFTRVSDATSNEDRSATAMVNAVRCCANAFAADSAAALEFYTSGTGEDDSYVMMLTTIARYIDAPQLALTIECASDSVRPEDDELQPTR